MHQLILIMVVDIKLNVQIYYHIDSNYFDIFYNIENYIYTLFLSLIVGGSLLFYNRKNTKWKKNTLGIGWVLGETLITGIGQGYIQTTPLQLCLMMAQFANGGYEIKPRIIDDKYSLQPIVDAWREEFISKNKYNYLNN